MKAGSAGAPGPEDAVEASRMPFVEHLRELRKRILWALLAPFVLLFVAFAFREPIFQWTITPLRQVEGLQDQPMQVLGLMEMFVTYLKLAALAAVFASAPWMLLQLWLFVAPGLYGHERRWLGPFIVLGTAFFVGGGAFAFYLVLPLGFEQLVQMVPEEIQANFRVSEYVGLVIRLLLAFGIVFELPLIMWILAAAGIGSPAMYGRIRKYWLVLAFIIGALLTPPDPITQTMMAIPLVLFFELGVLGARVLYRRHDAA